VNVGGLNLQTIVDVDSLFGVSNADRAARQYLRYCSSVRDAVSVNGSAVLNPASPLTLQSLVPSARVTVSAYGVVSLMEIQSVDASFDDGDFSVAINLESVDDDPPELIKIEGTQ
jgi:predicted component of type VI protein secretion system